jgi:chromosome segregation ATPase
MSKKIAQLTKVIFHLNSKNEDHQDDLAAVSDAYETEIDQILKDCASKVSKFKDKLEERKHVEREQTAVNQLLKQHEAEKKAAMEEFEKMRKKAQEEAAKQKKVHEAGVKMMVKDMESMKADFKTRYGIPSFAQKYSKRSGQSKCSLLRLCLGFFSLRVACLRGRKASGKFWPSVD